MSSREICSHHILCVGDATIPYARLSSLCVYNSCPPELRDRLRIYVHLDALKQDTDAVAQWMERTPGTMTTQGIFGISSDEEEPVEMYQAMINTLSTEYAGEPAIAVVDADLFLTDDSWFRAALTHQPERDYSLAGQFRGGRLLHYHGKSFRSIQTKLFTLSPAIHNEICDQRIALDVAAMDKLLTEFPDARLEMGQKIDCMVVPSFKAQILGYRVAEVGKKIPFAHVGGFSYMHVDRLKVADSRVLDRWLTRIKFATKTSRLLRRIGLETSPGLTMDKWLTRVRFNKRVLHFFEQLGWEPWLDPDYSARIEAVVQLVEGQKRLVRRQASLGLTSDELIFEEQIESRLNHYLKYY